MRKWYNFLQYQRISMLIVAIFMLSVLYVKGRQSRNYLELATLSNSVATVCPVQVSGDVGYPGIYEMPDKKMTITVIKMIEPLCKDADILLKTLENHIFKSGEAIVIRCNSKQKQSVITFNAIPASQLITLGMPINLNTATDDDLELIPGIGPTTAKNIIEYRHKNGDFESLDQLLEVDGIGNKKIKVILKYLNI